jgi:phage tail-like protein
MSQLYYPPVGFHFDVRIIGESDVIETVTSNIGATPKIDGKFSEVSGISFQMQTESYNEGGENRFAYQLPQTASFSPLVLKRGLVSSSSALGNWIKDTITKGLNNPVELKHIIVILLNEEHMPILGWLFVNAYPIKWQTSDLNAMQNEILVETAEFAYHRFETFEI